MRDKNFLFLNSGETLDIVATIESHIRQSQSTHLGQCQQLENTVWETSSGMTFLREPSLDYVNLMRQRYQSIFDFYDQSFLPGLRQFTEEISQGDRSQGAAERAGAED
jgi:hypothetical protein